MGRYAGWIALYAGVSGGRRRDPDSGDPFTYEAICSKIEEREKVGKHFTLIIVAEAPGKGGSLSPRPPR